MRTILFIELLGGIGDVLIALSAIQALGRSHPNAKLTVLTFAPGSELLKDDPLIHHVIGIEPELNQVHQARNVVEALLDRCTFDLIVSDTNYDGIDHVIQVSNALQTVTNLWRSPPSHQRVGDRFLQLLLADGLIQPDAIGTPQLHLTSAEILSAQQQLGHVMPPLVVLYPDAGMAIKRWSTANFVMVGRELHQQYGATIVVPVGSHPEQAEHIASEIGNHAQVWQQGTLRSLGGLMAIADLVIAADTGPARIAAALDTPTITLFGPSWHDRYGQPAPHINLQGYPGCPERNIDNFTTQCCWYSGICPFDGWQTCLDAISPAEVMAAAAPFLHLPASKPGKPTLELGTSSLELGTPSLELQRSSLELGTPSSELQPPSLELGTPSLELQPPSSELGTLSSELQPPSSELQPPSSELGTLSSELQPPSSELGTPSSELQPPSSELGTPSSELQPPSSELGTPSSELQPPSSELHPPSSELPPPPSLTVDSALWHQWSGARNILVMRLDNIGDVLMISPALHAIKDALPEARLTLMASPGGTKAAALLPWLDDVLTCRALWQDLGKLPFDPDREGALIATLRDRQFDAAIIFTSFSQTPHPAAFMCYLAGIPLRLGESKEWGGAVLSTEVKAAPDTIHQVERNLRLIEAVGFPVRDRSLCLHIPEAAQQRAIVKLQEHGLEPGEPYLLLNPWTSCQSRNYAVDRFAIAAHQLAERTGDRVVVTGMASDRPHSAPLLDRLGTHAINLIGDTDLSELAALIANARLMLSNNTSTMHLADATRTPSVILFAGTEYESQWQPRSTNAKLLRQPTVCSPCYAFTCPYNLECLDIPPETVVATGLTLLGMAE
ncbi:MAG: hypothetical protein KME42_21335 [Tildeniella nuda ZEHNDER 1965/U140]|jgi:ADP-heptose:LPS heptosyltransferase|nr:hypothetical protein [Tildeniella nuda ZEHNDER 1965/U140]